MAQSSARYSPRRFGALHALLGRWRPRPAGAGPLEKRRRFQPRLEMLEDRTLLSPILFGQPGWEAQGPAPITGGNTVLGPTAATTQKVGAINAIAVDPTNAKHLFVASVNGGIWQTADFTAATPSWSTTTDQMPSLAMSAIAFSPVNSNVIYAGTGSYSSVGASFNSRGIGGGAGGVHKSIDGGATWQVLNPNGIFSNLRIERIIPTTAGSRATKMRPFSRRTA